MMGEQMGHKMYGNYDFKEIRKLKFSSKMQICGESLVGDDKTRI